MYQIACPSCGAQLSFRSAAAVVAVCAYCQSTLLREGDAVRDIGKMSAVLEDYSPLQIGVSGVFEGRTFNVVGRIQLVYDDGFWNEWFLWFDDGQSGWLSDASGQTTVTTQVAAPADAIDFERLQPGSMQVHEGIGWVAADVRVARCIGGQGELPFSVGAGWEARVADFRSRDRFLTLDYSDSLETPTAWRGKAVSLEGMKCQRLRSPEQIAESAGKLRGSVASLVCPSCGGGIKYVAGMAQHMMCPSCRAPVGLSAGLATALGVAARVEARQFVLSLGDVARIEGVQWTLIGLMVCRETGEDSEWTEYLLHNPQRGFRWIVQSSEGWDMVLVLDDWPVQAGNGEMRHRERVYRKLYDYGAEVVYAIGAFNWRVKIGDTVMITDYRHAQQTLCCERSRHEQTWSLATRVDAALIAQCFGKPMAQVPRLLATASAGDEGYSYKTLAVIFTGVMLLINVPMFFKYGSDAADAILFGLFMLWWPALKGDGHIEEEDD